MPEWDELPGAVRATCKEVAGRVRRGVLHQGSERDVLVLGAKTVVAAMGAWMLARHFLPSAVATFAPFTALVALQTTVYRSVRHCAQYLIAMTVGAALAASLAAAVGIHGWTFGVLTLAALALGRVRRLGEQGTQVAIVGFFAFSSGQGRIDYIGHLVASVVIGALCGLTAHLVLAPARHTRHRQEAVADLYEGVRRRVNVLADTIEAENADAARVEQLRHDWRRLSADADRIRHAIDAETENGRLNPRRSIAGAAEALPGPRKRSTWPSAASTTYGPSAAASTTPSTTANWTPSPLRSAPRTPRCCARRPTPWSTSAGPSGPSPGCSVRSSTGRPPSSTTPRRKP